MSPGSVAHQIVEPLIQRTLQATLAFLEIVYSFFHLQQKDMREKIHRFTNVMLEKMSSH